MPYLPPETCVVPDVDCGTACTWFWFSAKCHELVVECVVFFQQIWLLNPPRSEHGMTLPVKLQWVEIR
jgi:hypothetical protein